jgi:hypothetical protein
MASTTPIQVCRQLFLWIGCAYNRVTPISLLGRSWDLPFEYAVSIRLIKEPYGAMGDRCYVRLASSNIPTVISLVDTKKIGRRIPFQKIYLLTERIEYWNTNIQRMSSSKDRFS